MHAGTPPPKTQREGTNQGYSLLWTTRSSASSTAVFYLCAHSRGLFASTLSEQEKANELQAAQYKYFAFTDTTEVAMIALNHFVLEMGNARLFSPRVQPKQIFSQPVSGLCSMFDPQRSRFIPTWNVVILCVKVT